MADWAPAGDVATRMAAHAAANAPETLRPMPDFPLLAVMLLPKSPSMATA